MTTRAQAIKVTSELKDIPPVIQVGTDFYKVVK